MPPYQYKTVPTESREKTYRCKVIGNTGAVLFVRGRQIKVQVRETSGSGFTIGIPPKHAKKIKFGTPYVMHYDDRRVEVMAETFTESVQGEARLQVGTLREFEPKERWGFRFPFSKGKRVVRYDSAVDTSAAYGGFVLVLFCVMSLPGIGERLGTAPRIEAAVTVIYENVQDVMKRFSN